MAKNTASPTTTTPTKSPTTSGIPPAVSPTPSGTPPAMSSSTSSSPPTASTSTSSSPPDAFTSTSGTPLAMSPTTSGTPPAMSPTTSTPPPAKFPSTATPPAKETAEVVLEDKTVAGNTEDKTTGVETIKAIIVEADCRVLCERYVIRWKINNFNLIRFVTGYGISGPIFAMGKEHETEWQLLMVKQRDDKGNPQIGFKMRKPYDTAVWDSIDYTVSIVTEDDRSLKCVTASAANDGKCRNYHFYDSTSKTEDEPSLDELFQEKTVTVEANVEYSYMPKVAQGPEEIDDESMLSTDMMRLYSTSKFSDLVVCAGDRQFRVHKSILCARSAYFNRKLWEEPDAELYDRIELQDSKEVIEEMLLYIYTGNFSQTMTKELCKGLWEAAINYSVYYLPIRCKNFMLGFLRCHDGPCNTCHELRVSLADKTGLGPPWPQKIVACEAIFKLKSGELPNANGKSNDQMVDSKTQTTEMNVSKGLEGKSAESDIHVGLEYSQSVGFEAM